MTEQLEERILHVDEDDITQEFMQAIFNRVGVKVDSAYDYDKAIDALKDDGFKKYTGLVFSANFFDAPEKNGLALVKYVLNRGFDTDSYPIILIAPEEKLETLRKEPEILARRIICIPELKDREEPEVNEIISIYLSRRGL